jgi:hypothetical protein
MAIDKSWRCFFWRTLGAQLDTAPSLGTPGVYRLRLRVNPNGGRPRSSHASVDTNASPPIKKAGARLDARMRMHGVQTGLARQRHLGKSGEPCVEDCHHSKKRIRLGKGTKAAATWWRMQGCLRREDSPRLHHDYTAEKLAAGCNHEKPPGSQNHTQSTSSDHEHRRRAP